MARSKFHRCLKCSGEMLKCSGETLGKIFACTRGEPTESSKNLKNWLKTIPPRGKPHFHVETVRLKEQCPFACLRALLKPFIKALEKSGVKP